jgi:hypothetical protein
MTPEEFVERLKVALPAGLKSVVLYGSAAAGDFLPGKSDYNVVIVSDPLGLPELDALAGPVSDWTRAGNEAPLLFTSGQLATSADAFPIELADMRQSRKTLFGEDLLAGIKISPAHLRLQLERELKGKLLSLRRRYLQTTGDNQRLANLMAASLSTILVLFRAALRLFQPEVPATKIEALSALARHIPFDPEPFRRVYALKEGPAANVAPATELFADYLRNIEIVIEAVDRHIHANRSRSTDHE